MSDVEIWHNPKCSKSRETLALLKEHNVTPRVRLYLEDAPDRATLAKTAKLLGGAKHLLRADEDGAPPSNASDDVILDALAKNPRLIQRPVVFANGKAAMGRPPNAVLSIVKA
jgi:arsenate reductase (glutaredoxin)